MKPLIAIACGGTGGHLFPGIAVAEELLLGGCDILLLISKKEVDQHAVRSAPGMEVAALPAVGFSGARAFDFCRGFASSFCQVRKHLRQRPAQAVLAMGGFTSAPPVLAGKSCGALTFLHESNTIPGRANRWLSHVVDQAFVGFPSAAKRLYTRNVVSTGTPVRPQFQPAEPASCRIALGLAPNRSTVLVMGGSQGASAINQLIENTLPLLTHQYPELQYIHLCGHADVEKVTAAYERFSCRALVRPFLTEMELALGAATFAVSRAGASSLAELAAVRLPSILIPYPSAAGNHQWHNARAYAEAGAALLLEQRRATPEKLLELARKLLSDSTAYTAMREELVRWHAPSASRHIAQKILALLKAYGFDAPVVTPWAAHAA
jgi:UDP-N-acetylglucosamine--N-acetylmuramyl-(pentapeptide) pyrophosphoryl-undecaprenol N-acetylglucosamine transferase